LTEILLLLLLLLDYSKREVYTSMVSKPAISALYQVMMMTSILCLNTVWDL